VCRSRLNDALTPASRSLALVPRSTAAPPQHRVWSGGRFRAIPLRRLIAVRGRERVPRQEPPGTRTLVGATRRGSGLAKGLRPRPACGEPHGAPRTGTQTGAPAGRLSAPRRRPGLRLSLRCWDCVQCIPPHRQTGRGGMPRAGNLEESVLRCFRVEATVPVAFGRLAGSVSVVVRRAEGGWPCGSRASGLRTSR
jgi:hypothetical protein